jgi:hypothetical protein
LLNVWLLDADSRVRETQGKRGHVDDLGLYERIIFK